MGSLNEAKRELRACNVPLLRPFSSDSCGTLCYLLPFCRYLSRFHLTSLSPPFPPAGAQETRIYGKRLIWNLKQLIGNSSDFDRLVSLLQPALLQKKVHEVLEGLNGPPPPPSRAVPGSRLVSRQAGGATPSSPSTASRFSGAAAASGGTAEDQQYGGRGGSFSAPVGAHSSGAAPPLLRVPQRGAMPPLGGGASGGASGSSDRNRGGGSSSQHSSAGGLPPRGGGSSAGSSFGASGSGGGGGSGTMFSVQVQEDLAKAVALMSAKDFRERIDGLKGVDVLAPSLSTAPEGTVIQLLDNMTVRGL